MPVAWQMAAALRRFFFLLGGGGKKKKGMGKVDGCELFLK